MPKWWIVCVASLIFKLSTRGENNDIYAFLSFSHNFFQTQRSLINREQKGRAKKAPVAYSIYETDCVVLFDVRFDLNYSGIT